MRPLGHLGIGIGTADFNLNNLDEKLYDALSERGDTLLQETFENFMGSQFKTPPKKTFKQIKEAYEYRLERKTHLLRLGVPKEIMDHEDEIVVKLYNDLKNKNFVTSKDPAYTKYRNAYEKRLEEWEDSDIKENLLNEIYAYNEAEYNNIKLQQEYASR